MIKSMYTNFVKKLKSMFIFQPTIDLEKRLAKLEQLILLAYDPADAHTDNAKSQKTPVKHARIKRVLH